MVQQMGGARERAYPIDDGIWRQSSSSDRIWVNRQRSRLVDLGFMKHKIRPYGREGEGDFVFKVRRSYGISN
nr:hypothetical protein [Tanacetum cinerariifolium]